MDFESLTNLPVIVNLLASVPLCIVRCTQGFGPAQRRRTACSASTKVVVVVAASVMLGRRGLLPPPGPRGRS